MVSFQANKIRNAQKVVPVEMDKMAVDPKSIATFMDSMSKAKKRTGVLLMPDNASAMQLFVYLPSDSFSCTHS